MNVLNGMTEAQTSPSRGVLVWRWEWKQSGIINLSQTNHWRSSANRRRIKVCDFDLMSKSTIGGLSILPFLPRDRRSSLVSPSISSGADANGQAIGTDRTEPIDIEFPRLDPPVEARAARSRIRHPWIAFIPPVSVHLRGTKKIRVR
jgi:hypothetical protein